MSTYSLSDTQLVHLSSVSQHFELYVALLPAFTLTATSINVADPANVQYVEDFVWRPVVRMGPNRVGVVGQPMTFYGGDSYVRGGGAAVGHAWDFGDGSQGSGTTVSHAYANPGVYQVRLTVDDGQGRLNQGWRWVRVYQDWEHAYDGIVEVRSLGASIEQGGWHCELRCAGDPADFVDRAGVVLYAKDYWDVANNGLAIVDTVGLHPERYDPGIVMTGYIVGDTVRADWDTHDITFTVRTPEYFLQNTSMLATDFWSATASGWGHRIPNLTFADAIQHILVEHTNFASFHDVVLWQDNNVLTTLTLNEGSIWTWIQDMAKNEFGFGYCDKNSALYIVPNVNVRGLAWWGSQDPPVMDFNKNNILHLEIGEQPSQRVGYVEINATDPTQRNPGLQGKYPATPGTVGQWEFINEILCEDQGVLDALARRYYAWRNARYTARIVTGLNHALDLNQIVTLSYVSEQ